MGKKIGIIALLAGLFTVGVAGTAAACEHEGGYYGGYYGYGAYPTYGREGWFARLRRERAWREHERREHGWGFRRW